MQALAELRARSPDAHALPERLLLCCLFARKLDVARAAELVRRHVALRSRFGVAGLVRFRDLGLRIRTSGSALAVDGRHDRAGRLVVYMYPGRAFPREYGEGDAVRRMVWAVDRMSRVEPLRCLREGVTLVYGLEGLSAANADDPERSRRVAEALDGALPLRVRSVLLVEPGLLLRPLIAAVKSTLKAKLASRVEIIKRAHLTQRIDAANLSADFGGLLQVSPQQLVAQYEREDDAIAASEAKHEEKHEEWAERAEESERFEKGNADQESDWEYDQTRERRGHRVLSVQRPHADSDAKNDSGTVGDMRPVYELSDDWYDWAGQL